MDDTPLSISRFQRYIRQRYYASDHARGTAGTFMWFIEEVGELATALHQAADQDAATSGKDSLEEEFADVFAWLCTLANINDVDLEHALRTKYLKDGGPEGHK